jgi:hypothetical protein
VLHSRVGSRPYPQTLDPIRKGFPERNVLAYYEKSLLTAVKSFTTLAPDGFNVSIQGSILGKVSQFLGLIADSFHQ